MVQVSKTDGRRNFPDPSRPTPSTPHPLVPRLRMGRAMLLHPLCACIGTLRNDLYLYNIILSKHATAVVPSSHDITIAHP